MEERKRQDRRFPCFGTVEIIRKQTGNPSLIVSALLSNISRIGMKCNAPDPVEKGARVTIVIIEFMDEKVDERIDGTVVWISGSRRSYYMGIRFDEEINEDTHPGLYKSIHESI